MMELNRELTAIHDQVGRRIPQGRADHAAQADLLPGARAQAFSDPEVAKKLNLKEEQKTEIQTIVQEAGAEMRTIFQENQDDREAAMKKIQELNKQTLSKVESKLNDEQQKTWKELLGSPFTVVYEAN